MNLAPMYTDLCSVASSGMSSCADVSHGHHVTIGRYIAGLYMGAVRFFFASSSNILSKSPHPKKEQSHSHGHHIEGNKWFNILEHFENPFVWIKNTLTQRIRYGFFFIQKGAKM